ncbi:MAG: hypothetical protein KGJ13_12580 [Patescibacteria group bacterium]|nr:hypothetical protein [Patescibacteria group bacterium]
MAEFAERDSVAAPDEQPYDASDPTQVNNRRRSESRRRAAQKQVLPNLLSTPAGRNWMWDKLEACRVFQTSFDLGDPHATTFNEGQRNIGLMLLADIGAQCPDALVLMMREKGKA